jgi:hypothetical protein
MSSNTEILLNTGQPIELEAAISSDELLTTQSISEAILGVVAHAKRTKDAVETPINDSEIASIKYLYGLQDDESVWKLRKGNNASGITNLFTFNAEVSHTKGNTPIAVILTSSIHDLTVKKSAICIEVDDLGAVQVLTYSKALRRVVPYPPAAYDHLLAIIKQDSEH